MSIVRRSGVVGVFLLGCVTARGASADVVTDWDNVLINAIRATGGGPGPIARNGALMHVAIYDAVNSIDHGYQTMHTNLVVPATTSKVAAAAQAAHNVLAELYPAAQYPTLNAAFNNALATSLAAVPVGQAKIDGISLGQNVAASTMIWHAADGSSANVPYTATPGPGVWQPTAPDFTPAWGPGWGAVTPMVMPIGSMFRPPPPPALTSQAYIDATNEVKSLGSINSATRTKEQTDIAYFWANDRNGSEKPPGQLNVITQIIAANKGNTLEQNARLFALVNVAMMEASVAAWDEKFTTDLWRPIDAIRNAAQVNNGIVADPTWTPLSDQLNGWTPPFPAYISGHATFAGAWAEVLKDYYGTDAISFDATSGGHAAL
jgi:hypothetical protein